MTKKAIAIISVIMLLAACSDGDGGSRDIQVTVTQPDPITPVLGGGVKGPLVDAVVNLYVLDLAESDLKGDLISTGSTDARAAITGIGIASGSVNESFLLEVLTDEDTVDLNSGLAPVLTSYETIVTSSQIREGRVFATPITSLAIKLATTNGPFADQAAFDQALEQASKQVISVFGFGLDVNTNPFTSNPLLTESDSTNAQQAAVIGYRLAVEGVAAILDLIATEARGTASEISADDVLVAIAEDLTDGRIDGQIEGANLDVLSGVTDVTSIIATDPELLMIPGTDRPITAIAEFVVSETSATGATVTTTEITSGSVFVTASPARVNSDIDGDGVGDTEDAFPDDPTETVDSDGDGTGNNADSDDDNDNTPDEADAFPLNSAEDTDTDVDGVGNNEDPDDDGDGVLDADDALPLDPSESVDTDQDGIGNNADTDDDGDGTEDSSDAFPLLDSEQLDTDGDGIGNNEDTDDDGDGVADVDDTLPLDARASSGVSATVGAEGGILTSADDQLTLTIPAGALASETTITIATPTAVATSEFNNETFVVSGHYLLEPDGTQFAEPVEVKWNIPSSQPDALRFVYTLSDGVISPTDEPSVVDTNAGEVTADISHFSDLFVVTGAGVFAINQPTAGLNEELTWIYEYDLQDDNLFGDFTTEGTTLLDGDGNLGITRQPSILSGDTVISDPNHEQAVFCSYTKDGDGNQLETCYPSPQGSIVATCTDSSADGLKATIGFNLDFKRAPELVITAVSLLEKEARGLYKVEANGFCRDSIEITEPKFISIGADVDRITRPPEDFVVSECNAAAQPYDVVVSNTRTSLINASGCSRNLNYDANNNQIFGTQLVTAGDEARLFTYGESGVFIVTPEDNAFGQLSDFQNTTTDIKYAVTDNGLPIASQVYSVNNAGSIKLRTLNSDGTNSNQEAFNAVGVAGDTFISFAPITSTTGVGVTSRASSRAYFVDHGADTPTATEIGTVGDTALGIYCTRLSCDSSSTACTITNNETVGCLASAFNSEEVYPFYSTDVVNNLTIPTFNFTQVIPGVVTASPFVQSNRDGQMVIATVNDNEIGKVQLVIQNADGTQVRTANFFLTDYQSVTGFVANGSSIILLEPSAEYPNGAIRIGLRNESGQGDGVLTIPASESLLGTSPAPFFGPAFEN